MSPPGLTGILLVGTILVLLAVFIAGAMMLAAHRRGEERRRRERIDQPGPDPWSEAGRRLGTRRPEAGKGHRPSGSGSD